MKFNKQRKSVLLYALSQLIEHLASSESADRAADAGQADENMALATEVKTFFESVPEGADLQPSKARVDDEAPAVLSEIERTVLVTHLQGEFAHLVDAITMGDLHSGVAESGEGLLRFMMSELAPTEDCDSFEVAIGRINAAIEDLELVRSALSERMEESNESSVMSLGQPTRPAQG